MKREIEKILKNALLDLDLGELTVIVIPTDDPSHGDYATNVAFQAGKKLGKSPLEAAESIIKHIGDNKDLFDHIEIAKPGFINFFLSKQALLKSLSADTSNIASDQFKNKKIMIEFTDPNPFKEFHIGHLYSNIVGESISRLLESVGAEVRRVCYQGDVGLHVAKALWGLQRKMLDESKKTEDIEKLFEKEKAKYLGEAYALGAQAYEEDPHAKEEIVSINKKVYAKDAEIMKLYDKGRQWSLAYFQSIYERLGTAFAQLYFESDAGPIGLELVKEFQAKDVFRESQGAVVFPGEEHGLHTRVFINSLGLPTYEAKELGLAVTKYQDYPFDLSIMITGNEINEYFKVLLKALSLIKPEIAAKMKHLSHGMVRLPEGKMSSRTGNVITGEWLLDEAVIRSEEKIKNIAKRSDEISGQTTEIIGVGAVKWALLRSGIGKDIEFSFDESVSFEGNSGPYLQYTYVRTKSVLDKAGEFSFTTFDGELTYEERQLLVYLSRYEDIITEAAESFSPNIVCTYLFELAQLFNLFYQKHPIMKADDDLKNFRLAVTKQVGVILKEGLQVLGIKAPEKM